MVQIIMPGLIENIKILMNADALVIIHLFYSSFSIICRELSQNRGCLIFCSAPDWVRDFVQIHLKSILKLVKKKLVQNEFLWVV